MDGNEGMIQVKHLPKQSNTLGAIGTTLGGAALGGVALNAIGNTMSRYLGNIGANLNAISGAPGLNPVAAPVAVAPGYGPVYVSQPVAYAGCCNEGGYVTKEVATLMSENAQLKAEKYTDNTVRELSREFYSALNQQAQSICALDKLVAVNMAHDEDFRREVKSCYVHQPRVHFDRRVIQTTDDCCCDTSSAGQ